MHGGLARTSKSSCELYFRRSSYPQKDEKTTFQTLYMKQVNIHNLSYCSTIFGHLDVVSFFKSMHAYVLC
jgi:hypothetical protein